MANKFLDDNGLLYFWQKIINKIKANIVNDLTTTSTDKSLSAAQGKVLNDKIDAINLGMENLGAGDMLKSKYDVDNNGQVDKADDADKLGGQLPSYYAKAIDLDGYVSISAKGQANGVATLGADGKVPENQLPETAPIEHTHEMSEVNGLNEAVNNLTGSLNNKANLVHTHEKSDINGLEDAISDMTEIASGKCACYVFDTVDDLDTALTEYVAFLNDGTEISETNILKGETLKTGDVFLIRAVDVPDYWWDENTTSKQILETTKVNLTTITNPEIDTIVATE